MFLTLLKTALLCGFLSIGVSSRHDYLERAPIQRDIISQSNDVVNYDENGIRTIVINSSDVEDFCLNFGAFSTTTYFVSPNARLTFSSNNVPAIFFITRYSESFDSSYLRFYNDNDSSYIHVGAHNNVYGIYLVSGGSWTSLNSITIYLDALTSASDFYSSMTYIEGYFREIAPTFTISEASLNEVAFTNLSSILQN